MQRKIKGALSYVLALAMVVTLVNVYGVQSKAETTLDLTGVTADVNIVSGGETGLVNALATDSYVIDGVTYKNYTSYEGITAIASSEINGNAASNAVDGKTGNRWESEQGVDPQYLQIDLGNVYSLKAIGIYWEGASAENYKIEVSADGNTFEELTEVTSGHGKRTDEIKLSKEIDVRTIRINCLSRTTQYGDSIYEIGLYGTEVQKDVVSVLSNLTIRDYYKYTGKYMLYFTEADEAAGYNVYLDDSTTPIKTIESSGSFLDAEDLAGVSAGEHTLYVATVDDAGNESAKLSKTITIGNIAGDYNDIAQMYIYTPVSITTDYHDDKDVTITVVDENGEIDTVDTASNIKIRGNTTSWAPKKPWNIKLDKKKSILGMPKGKKWCILANSFDKSLMRNSLSYQMGLENGLDYNCESRYIEVYVNGVYNGNYLITEPVETGDGRVEIDPYNADNMDILLELGTRNEEGVDHFYTSTEVFDVNEPEKGDDLTDAEVDAKIARVQEFLKGFEATLEGSDYNAILEYIDEDSFVDFYIVNELFKNVDFDFSSTRFHINGDTIYAGPMWDLDLSSGNCKSSYYTNYYVDGVSWKGYYCQGMGWYKRLFKKDEFYSKVKARYAELQYVIQNIYKEGSTQANSIDSLVNTYGASFERNYMSTNLLGAGWELTNDDGYSFAAESGWTTWQQPIEFLRDWLENRNEWLCGEWGIDPEAAYEASKPGDEPTTQAPTTKPVETTTQAPTETTTQDPDIESGLSITNVTWATADGKKTFDVDFTPVSSATTGDADPYLYCIYLDEMNSDHSAVNYSAEWNWKSNFAWLNGAGGFNNAYKFDGVFTTASDFAANGKASTYLEDGADHKVIIAAYATVADAQADVNPVAVAEKSLSGDDETTTKPVETTTDSVETTTDTPTETTTAEPVETTTDPTTQTPTTVAPTTKQDVTTVAPTDAPSTKLNKPAKAKIKKVNAKKKSSKKVKISLKKIKGAVGYQVAIYKTKKNAKKNKKALVKKIVKKRKFTIKSKKLKNKKTLFVKARAFVLDAKGKNVYGKWSKIKKVKIKK